MNVILLEPEIPQNTGNIGRTCCATGTKLHLIEPMGFRINEKNLKRAGMDYWDDLDVTIYDSFKDFIPMNPEIRSLNLANSVAIVLYEALRQNDFHGMQMEGHLHRLQWKE